jgi:hypothetical protein
LKKQGFQTYARSSSNRPIHEVLFTPLRDIRHDYEHNFRGMTAEPVPLDVLLAARERMMRELHQGLGDDERRFLLSLAAGTPEWSLLGIAHLEQLPGIRWKLHNLTQLQKTDARRFAEQPDLLAARPAAVPRRWLMMSRYRANSRQQRTCFSDGRSDGKGPCRSKPIPSIRRDCVTR